MDYTITIKVPEDMYNEFKEVATGKGEHTGMGMKSTLSKLNQRIYFKAIKEYMDEK